MGRYFIGAESTSALTREKVPREKNNSMRIAITLFALSLVNLCLIKEQHPS
jgi:hypothetical protein